MEKKTRIGPRWTETRIRKEREKETRGVWLMNSINMCFPVGLLRLCTSCGALTEYRKQIITYKLYKITIYKIIFKIS